MSANIRSKLANSLRLRLGISLEACSDVECSTRRRNVSLRTLPLRGGVTIRNQVPKCMISAR